MISINGQTYTSYRGVVIEGSDRVFQGTIDGLVNTAPGQTMSLDGDGYTIDTVSWQAGSVPATKVKGYKSRLRRANYPKHSAKSGFADFQLGQQRPADSPAGCAGWRGRVRRPHSQRHRRRQRPAGYCPHTAPEPV